MRKKGFTGARGRIERLEHHSDCLQGNALGDPATRPLHVYLPAAYDEDPGRRFPVLFDLVGFTGSGLSHSNWMSFQENLPERLDRLQASGKMGPAIVVLPDCFSSLGGNQYIDSSAIGPYARYLIDELVPFIDSRYRSLADRRHRGLFGKSSGGYGAMIHAMRYAETWGAAACHSGDMYFEYCYQSELPSLLNQLAKHEHSAEAFLAAFEANPKPSGDEIHAIMTLCMAASYDPNPDLPLGFELPCDLRTGELNTESWKRWLRHDPVRIIEEACAQENLASLALLYIDCGSRDQYNLQYGARILHGRLVAAGIAHRYEEFDDDHSGVDYRMDESLPALYEALKPR